MLMAMLLAMIIQEDELLIKRAQKGEVDAFEELIAKHEKRIYNIALRTMKSAEDAKDMAQEAIIKIYRSIAGFKGDCTFAVWVYRITVNTCLDELRRKKKRTAVSLDHLADQGVQQFEDEGETPEESLSRKELGGKISAAIASLDDDYRVAVTLRDVQGLSYQEIAEITGATLGTVKSRINRARAQLQKKLHNYVEQFA